MNYLAVFIGGGIGSLARYLVSKFFLSLGFTSFPVSTLISNFLSSLILIITVVYFAPKMVSYPWLSAFILVGFCGGFSTFSTFSYETVVLFKSGNFIFALFNILISVTVGVSTIYFIFKN